MLDLIKRPELLLAVLEAMQDGFSVVNAEAVQVFVNDALCRMTGYTRDELLGQTPVYPYWPEEALPAIDAAFRATLAGQVSSYELTFKRKDGTRFPVIVSPSSLRTDDGRVLAHFATIKDISERKQLESALAESEQRWRSIAENPFDFVVVIDRDCRFTFVNHTAPGITREELMNATLFDYAEERNHPAMREAVETAFRTGRAASYDAYVTHLDKWYSNIVGPIFENGQVTSASILTRDITSQKKAEEALLRSERQLREAHKMETIGTLAGGIAHDLNNMLTPVLGFTELAQKNLPREHPVQHELRSVQEGAARARDLVQRILLFSRRGEPHKSVLDLRACVAGDIKLLKGSIPANVEVVMQLPEQPLLVFADRTQIGQVVTNLVTNAVQAMRTSGGKLELTVDRHEPNTTLHVGSSATQRPCVALVVRDSGPGMDEETKRRAFEPFFTTKPTGSGTGLGLSIVHGIVLDHGGSVWLESEPPHGSVFTVLLPLFDPRATHPAPATPHAAEAVTSARPLRVLCVDDEPAVIALARAALARDGHTVMASSNPLEALALFESAPDTFDVVVTDQTMPRLTGIELVSAIRALRPLMPCLLITGLDDAETEQGAAAVQVREILRKPFSVDTLCAAVERAGASAGPEVG
jgi:two-component system cell cycle sensor histidine kinase/response regulator CckA